MKLKLIAIGNSTGVILPKELLDKLRMEKGMNCTRWRRRTDFGLRNLIRNWIGN